MQALELYKVVKDSREGIANVALWNKMLHCFDLSGDFEGAVGMFSEILLGGCFFLPVQALEHYK